MGITTLAPASMPFSRPSGVRLARAVVEGINASGCISRKMESSVSVCVRLPGGQEAKGVS